MLGGAVGTALRYLVSEWALKVYEGALPLGTIMVNAIGSMLIGLAWGFTDDWNWSKEARLFVFVGLFGGFTTFSSYTLETLNLVRENEVRMAIGNVLISNILGIILVFAGFGMGRLIKKI